MKEFPGKLTEVSPSRLFTEKTTDKTANFFLVLSVVYNDLKGILLFQSLVAENYRRPGSRERSVHSGEYSGLHIQLTRILIGTIHEFFNFLEKNKEVLETLDFKDALKATNQNIEKDWKDILGVVFGGSQTSSNFRHNLGLIRHNISFHYNQSGKELRRAFCSIFFKRKKIGFNDTACYSVGEKMDSTRFYYADAATEEYIRLQSNRSDKLESMSGYGPEMMEVIRKMNFAISRILEAYLKRKSKNN